MTDFIKNIKLIYKIALKKSVIIFLFFYANCAYSMNIESGVPPVECNIRSKYFCIMQLDSNIRVDFEKGARVWKIKSFDDKDVSAYVLEKSECDYSKSLGPSLANRRRKPTINKKYKIYDIAISRKCVITIKINLSSDELKFSGEDFVFHRIRWCSNWKDAVCSDPLLVYW